MKNLKRTAAAMMIAMVLLLGAEAIVHPIVTEAATVHKLSKKKRSKKYFTRTGFD